MTRPFTFQVPADWARDRGVDAVPGVMITAQGVQCTRDVALIVGRMLEYRDDFLTPFVSQYDEVLPSDLPGLADYYDRMHSRARVYQPPAAMFLASRTSAMECDGCRTGKNYVTLAASVMAKTSQLLVLTLGTPKLGWAEDIAKFLGVDALILEGRAGNDAWLFCSACLGRGVIQPDKSKPMNVIRCERCRSQWRSGWMRSASVEEAIERASVVIANYDIMIGQRERNAAGVITQRRDLLGWTPKLHKHARVDRVVLDEFHRIGDNGARTRAVKHITQAKHLKSVWGLSATPTDGRLIKMWSPLDLITGGMWGRSRKRYASRYCGGTVGQYGFYVPKDGYSPLADIELPERFRHLMIMRSRKELTPHLPPIDRHVTRLDAKLSEEHKQTDKSSEALERALDATARVKIPYVVDAILEDMREGLKVVCFTRRRDTGIEIADLVAKAIRSKKALALASHRADVWCCIGKSSDLRVSMSKAFNAHEGAGLFQATIDGFQTGVSLLGVSTNFFPDLHWDPTAIQQCEERAYVHERTHALVSVFFTLAGSSDDQVMSVLLPKLESLESVFGDTRAGEFRDTISPRETLDEIWARHTAHLR